MPTEHDDPTPDVAAPPAVASRSIRWRRWLPLLAFPLLVLVVSGVLVALDLNGSSVAILERDRAHDPRLVAGTPRSVRTDEFQLNSPIQVGNIRKDFPTHTWIGLTDTQHSVTSLGAPVGSWLAVFEPQTWPYFVLGIDRAFDVHWWAAFAVPLVGVYALLLLLRRRIALAATLAVMVGLSPLTAWWTGISPGLVVGFLCGAAAAFLAATRVRRTAAVVVLGLVAGFLGAAAFLVLYPPWLISVFFVLAAVVVGDLVERRVPWKRALAAAAPALVLAGLVLALWLHGSSSALSSITSTIYPGHRISHAGEGSASVLLSAPLNPVFAADAANVAPGPQVNQSEVASSWFPATALLLLVGLVVAQLVRRRHGSEVVADDEAVVGAQAVGGQAASAAAAEDGWRSWVAFLAVAGVMVLELAWMLVPLPAIVGKVTLLDRVPGNRVTVALGVGVVLLVHLAAGRFSLRRRPILAALAVVAVVAASALTAWSAGQVAVPGASGVGLAVVVAGVVTAAVLAVVLTVPRVVTVAAMVALVGVVAVNWAIVNPLYRGTGPLTHGPLATELARIADAEGPSRWVDLASGGSPAVILASRNNLVSGMTYYPTPDVWARLAPTQEDIWNNYGKYTWVYDPTAKPAVLSTLRGSSRQLSIDLCSPEVDFLDITYVLSLGAPPPCFQQVTTVTDLGQTYVISKRV